MTETILITGAGPRGVTGRLIKENFERKYKLLTPSSSELDLTNDEAVQVYFNNHKIDYVIHCATFRPTSVHEGHFVDEELESNLRMFFALAAQSSRYKKMIYFGSGAEFDKSKPMINIVEDDFGRSVPKNKYGLGKYIMNYYTRSSSNIYNFRLFGTINQYERFTKNVISNLCVKAIKGLPLELRQNCRFSFVDMNDISQILEYALTHELKYHDYNVCMSDSYMLSDIADIILKLSKRTGNVIFSNNGLNIEYTASNERIIQEFNPRLTPLSVAVERVYNYYDSIKDTIDISEIDTRWQ